MHYYIAIPTNVANVMISQYDERAELSLKSVFELPEGLGAVFPTPQDTVRFPTLTPAVKAIFSIT